jgi:hypothetical protein
MPASGVSRGAQRPLAIVPMKARGGGADDWPSVIGQANAIAGAGAVQLLPGNGAFKCATVVAMLSGATILGAPDVEIVSTLTPTGGPGGFAESVFFANVATAGLTTTLAVQPAIGAYSLSVVDDLVAVGDTILVGNAVDNVAQVFKVLAKSGAGPYALRLDDAVAFVFAAGKTVQSVVTPKEIRIEGRGMRVTGSGDRAVELAASERCVVRDLRVTRDAGVFEAFGASFDVGGRDNLFDGIEVDGANDSAGLPTSVGIALESNVRSILRRSRVTYVGTGGANTGIYIATCSRARVHDVFVGTSTRGLYLAESSGADLQGCTGCVVTSSAFAGNVAAGVLASGGTGHRFVAVAPSGTTAGPGFDIATGNEGAPKDVLLVACTSNDNAAAGVKVSGVGADVVATALVAHRNGTWGIDQQSDGQMQVCGFDSTDCVSGPWSNLDGTLEITRGHVRMSLNGFVVGAIAGVGTVELRGYTLELVGSPTGTKALADVQAAGKLRLQGVRTIGAVTFGVYAAHAVACKVVRGDDVDLSSCGTPFNIDATARANFGTFTANGATGVAVAGFFAADQPIAISCNTPAGTQGAQPFVTVKAANAFTVKATSLDTSLYDWKAL